MIRQARPFADVRRREIVKAIAGGVVGAIVVVLLVWALWILAGAPAYVPTRPL